MNPYADSATFPQHAAFPPQQQQQQQIVATEAYYGNQVNQAYMSSAEEACYGYQDQQQAVGSASGVHGFVPQLQQEGIPPGSLYSIESLQAQFDGVPISAVAYDTKYDAVFIASQAHSISRGRFDHRASMLVTHSTVDGSLYSAVAGHPEAPSKVLKNIYSTIYSVATDADASSVPSYRRKIPNHAFRPPFGSTDPGLASATSHPTFQMGINQLLPLGEGFVSSVSPAGVRIHSKGGLQTADFHAEGMLCMTAHPAQEGSITTHMSVGGIALKKEVTEKSGRSDLLCLDAWQGLRVVASYTASGRKGPNSAYDPIAVTALATSHSRGSVVAGLTDGSVRVLDSRLREVAMLKSHFGGVVNLAISEDGNLLASAGFGSRGSSLYPLYSFPDPNINFYDLRFLGRGAMVHSFTGLHGGPRHLSFLPRIDGQEVDRLLVASGQTGGGMQIIVPFEEHSSSDTSNFIVPQLEQGESITAMDLNDGRIGLGTSKGNLRQYRISEFKKLASEIKVSSGVFIPNASAKDVPKKMQAVDKVALQPPPYAPFQAPIADLSIDPMLLIKGNRGAINSARSMISSIALRHRPNASKSQSFGPLASDAMVGSSRHKVSSSFVTKSTHSMDFVRTVPATELEIDLMHDHRSDWIKTRARQNKDPAPNPNKFLYDSKLYTKVYVESNSRFRKRGRRSHQREGSEGNVGSSLIDVPARYRLQLRPTNKSAAAFSHSEHNSTNFPGWDYSPTMPNAFVNPVLMLLYFIPEARRELVKAQFAGSQGKKDDLVSELSFLFHRIDSLAHYAMIFQSTITSLKARVGAWSPSNLVACLGDMPEAEQLQILDGSPAAVETPRRPEAFYRFLFYQIDKELGRGKLMDSLGGVDFISVNEFNSKSTPPTTSSTRAMTVELLYEPFLNKGNPELNATPSFGEVLYRTLSRKIPLRAFNQKSGSYETIVQHKVASSLPKILSLSCACAGRKEEEGLCVWRGHGLAKDHDHWLPEFVEIEISENGNLVVRELVSKLGSDECEWTTFGDETETSAAVTEILAKGKVGKAEKFRYRLDAVVSMVRDDLDRNVPEELVSANESNEFGHHVLHVRVPSSYEERVRKGQRDELEKFISKSPVPLALVSNEDSAQMQQRLDHINRELNDMESGQDNDNSWMLFNGFNVSSTSVEDARAFHVPFKEPCIIIFRCQEEATPYKESSAKTEESSITVPVDAICTRSMTNNHRSNFYHNQKESALPGEGDLVAFDAEFVSVQEEVSALSETGSRLTVQETRHAMARISAISCKTRNVIFDDFVLPQERVVDYLTRFSGIVERDLNPKESDRHLISTKAAYLKLRCLMERGCIFVGHGLSRDFWTANLTVPLNQIIDTVEIYHKPAQRYISLRFLTNYVLKRDMQQEVHDSLEDATAALELYQKALELKEKGEFEKLLNDLYEYGQKVDWKLGIE